MIFLAAAVYSNLNSRQQDVVLSHFVTMTQNCGTPSLHMLHRLKIYTLGKILENGEFWVNVMCPSYNDVHDLLPSIWNFSHYFIGFI